MSGERERLALIMTALDYSMRHISETKRSLKESLTAGKVTAPLTLLEQFERDLEALGIQVNRLRNEVELALKSPRDRPGKLNLDGASKDILVMGLGMYELELEQRSSYDTTLNKSADTQEELRLIQETKVELDL